MSIKIVQERVTGSVVHTCEKRRGYWGTIYDKAVVWDSEQCPSCHEPLPQTVGEAREMEAK